MLAQPGVYHKTAVPVSEVFITAELDKRVPQQADYLKEKLALQDLAARMADQPEEILPRFVDLAMEMAGGSSAGISLFEEEPAPGVFRWCYLRGAFAPFEGTTTPRHFSPCGVTLDENRPVLSTYPERVYDWIAEANITVPEVLLVPLYLSGKVPSGTLWIVSDEVGHFDRGHARMAMELASFAGVALKVARTERRLQQALEEQQVLTQEMSHRVKNLFAITQGLVRVSARGAATKDQFAHDLSGRLTALADAHALVRHSFAEPGSNVGASDLSALVHTILRPHDGPTQTGARFSIGGPALECNERTINGLALVLHELATNAVKYGALQDENGHIQVSWRLEQETLLIRWVERGGPAIDTTPATAGFGSSLAQKIVVQQLGGTLDREWQPAGLVATITLPIEAD
jgi:two-component sensor histidine kinase